jgi:hypothetical protein
MASLCQTWRPVSITTSPPGASNTIVLPSGPRPGSNPPGNSATPGAISRGGGAIGEAAWVRARMSGRIIPQQSTTGARTARRLRPNAAAPRHTLPRAGLPFA